MPYDSYDVGTAPRGRGIDSSFLSADPNWSPEGIEPPSPAVREAIMTAMQNPAAAGGPYMVQALASDPDHDDIPIDQVRLVMRELGQF